MIPKQFEFPTFLNSIKRSINSFGGYSYKNGVLILEAPGFSKEDINIDLEDNFMHIHGKKEIMGEEYEISRKFSIPSYYLNDDAPIKAKVENGLIFIELTKKEKNKYPKVVIS